MATTEYATAAELQTYLLGGTKTQPTQADNFDAAVAAASRMIDGYTGRRFWKDDAATPRVYTATEFYEVMTGDISGPTGFVFKTDEDNDGVYETTWTLDSYTGAGVRLYPANAQTDPDIVKPYTRVRAIATSFPMWDLAIQVTAIWGWAAVPAAIHQATLLQAARLWKRKDAVLGVGGAAETGFFELRRRLDPDVRRLMDPYRAFAQGMDD